MQNHPPSHICPKPLRGYKNYVKGGGGGVGGLRGYVKGVHPRHELVLGTRNVSPA
jgi:hypothetical protein